MKKIIFIIITIILSAIAFSSTTLAMKYKHKINQLTIENENLSKDKDLYKDLYKEILNDKNPIDIEVEKCISKDYSTAGMNSCTYNGIDAWDKEMNNYIIKIKKELPQNQIILFEQTQSYWEDYYKSQQKLLRNTIYTKNGTIYTNITAGDIYELIKTRTLDLKNYFTYLTEEI